MKRLFNLILACLLIVSLSACGKQTGTDPLTDKVSGQDRQTESVETTEQTEQGLPLRVPYVLAVLFLVVGSCVLYRRQQHRKPHRLRQKRKMIWLAGRNSRRREVTIQ